MNLYRRLGSRVGVFVLTSVIGSGCDLGTKAWAERALAGFPARTIGVIEPWLELSLAYNRGTAFSVIADLGALRWVFGLLALAVVVGLFFVVRRGDADRRDALAFGAIAGGAIGNGVDRAFRITPGGGTGVVDFIKVNFPWGGSWPTFNIADCLVAIGVGLLILRRVRPRRGPDAAEPTAEDADAGALRQGEIA